MNVTRAIRCQVVFDGARKADLTKVIWPRLHKTRRELTVAANRLSSALYATMTGALGRPVDAGREVSLRSLSYQGMSGKWRPYGVPLYEPSDGAEASGMAKLAVAGLVFTRAQTDFRDVMRGAKALATFRELPITISGQGVRLDAETGRVSLNVWAGRRNNRVTVRPVRMDSGQAVIWRRIMAGEYKHGDARLIYAPRKNNGGGRWMLSLSWTADVAEASGDMIAGVDLSIPATAVVAYVDDRGRPSRRRDQLHTPRSIIRAWERLERERSERYQFNRLAYDVRAGRGRDRKLRAADDLTGKRVNLADTAVEQIAAAVVRAAEMRGAVVITLEKLTGVVNSYMDATEDDSRRGRARRRKWFLCWQQGRLREAIRSAAGKAGIRVVEVDPAHTSVTCHQCGEVWRYNSSAPKRRRKKREPFGRVAGHRFVCSCGYKSHTGYNAGINIARRGLAAMQESAE